MAKEVKVIKPRVRCKGCSKWFEPKWIHHTAHQPRRDCPGQPMSTMIYFPDEHYTTRCPTCQHPKIRAVTPEERRET